MNKRIIPISSLLAVSCLGLGAQAPNTLTREEAAAGWRLLFDGSSLNGWEPHEAAVNVPPATWSVAGGAIYCEDKTRGWLGSSEMFSDFHLKVDFRAGARINSGIFLRSQKQGGIPAETGYELQIWDFRPTYKTGALVNAIEAKPARILADQWNSYEVTADGDHFVVVLNGEKLLDGRDSKHSSGVVGLQYNTGGGRIEFRNIKIRTIKH